MTNMFDDLELEPEGDAPRLAMDPEVVDEGYVDPGKMVPFNLQRALPDSFDLQLLLRFLPDPLLKKKLDAEAARAVQLVVTGPSGLKAADASLVAMRAAIKEIETCFDEPTSLANSLHKRLTGLRSDFCANGEAAIKRLNASVYAENQRVEREAEAIRRKNQEAADADARKAAFAAAEEAKKTGMPAEVVQEMQAAAQTVTASPIAAPPRPAMTGSTAAPKWMARLKDTLPEAEPNPDVADMTPAQLASLKELLAAVVGGAESPAAVIKTLNWGYLNTKAKAEKTTLALPGLEAFDAGSVRAKPGRRK